MATDGTRPAGRHRDLPDPEDDLDRAFGPDTSSVPVRTTPQRVRAWSLLFVGVAVVAGVIVVALSMIIGSVQTGVGGIFPRPDATLQRFTADAEALDDVRTTSADDPVKTSFASYDVTATVVASPTLGADAQTELVRELSDAAKETSGNGVHVYAIADLGALDIGVSPSAGRTEQRLELARAVKAVAGVERVRCLWATVGDSRSDAPAAQSISIETAATGVDTAAVQAQTTDLVHGVFPDAVVRFDTART